MNELRGEVVEMVCDDNNDLWVAVCNNIPGMRSLHMNESYTAARVNGHLCGVFTVYILLVVRSSPTPE